MHRSVDMFEQFFTKLKQNENKKIERAIEYPDHQLNAKQSSMVSNVIESKSLIHVISGPPGTGKTHNLIELIKILFEKAEKDGTAKPKVLLTAPSN
mmetsp:Transcript_21447/g.47824  ORF Transcript_21447/g.47824 Transcript_21447/m.47824 type:complete len:96 (+) Transcript_21447:847-1134(+)